ncbi:MAG TPA: hypothetical protein VF204_24670 [Streptosporangiaceae bacterium]
MTRGSVPFLGLCGPSGVGKSGVGYEIFQQVCRSGIKASFMDFDQRRHLHAEELDLRGPCRRELEEGYSPQAY